MKMFRMIAFGVLVLAVGGGTAGADTILASLFSPVPPPGSTTTAINLTGITPPSQSTVTGPGYTVSFSGVGATQGVVQGTILPPGHAVPVAGVDGGNTPQYLTAGFGSALTTNIAASGNYLSTALGTITFTFSTPQTSLALLWGSIDTGNSLTFNDAANFVATGTAVQAAAAGFVGNGFQGPGGSAWVLINTTTPFTTVTATSSIVSFEFAGVAAGTFNLVPEPGSLVLLGSGMSGLIGMCLVSRRRSGTRSVAGADNA